MIDRLAAAATRSVSSLRMNLVAQGPLGKRAISFNTLRQNAINRVEDLPYHIAENNPAFVAPRQYSVSKEHYAQGTDRRFASIVELVAPKLDPNTVDCVVSYGIETPINSTEISQDFLFLISISEQGPLRVESSGQNYCLLACPELNVQELIISALLSLTLFRCFPFTLLTEKSEKARFLLTIEEKWRAQNPDQDGQLISNIGIPLHANGGIVQLWLQTLTEMMSVPQRKMSSTDASRFIVKTWRRQGGALSETGLRSLLDENSSYLTSHRPPTFRLSAKGKESALAAILKGKAALLASLQVPTPERQITLATLMRLDSFHRHSCCILSRNDLRSVAVTLFMDEQCLELYDSRKLVAVSHLLSREGIA
ncbi:MAG: hypothetical protein ACOH2H_17930 [Cypionkella sp.]